MNFRTRFAPSPTGFLHLGHAYSALLAFDAAKAASGEFLLRIEDTDIGRCKPEFETAILEDLAWLGLSWHIPLLHQTDRLDAYDSALNQLIEAGFCYPCSCSRRDIREALSAPQEGSTAHLAPDGVLYPGTCRHRQMQDRTENHAIRLNMAKVLETRPDIVDLKFTESGPQFPGTHVITAKKLLGEVGDIVLARRDIKTASYHLAVVVDDAAQEITDIVRGQDLFESTFVHRVVQALLDLPTPVYHHHALIRDVDGKRLAKRDDALAIRAYRAQGCSPAHIRNLVGLAIK